MTNLKLGIIGAGKMAGALVRGWVTSGLVSASQVRREYIQYDDDDDDDDDYVSWLVLPGDCQRPGD